MAYLDTTTVDDENLKKAQAQDAAQSIPGSGGSSVFSSGSTPQQSQDSSKQTSSGSWQNLQSYLDANQEQAAKMGQDIAGSIDKQGQQASSQLDNDVNSFKDQVSKNSVNYDPNFVDSALKDPTTTVADQDKANQFKQYFNANYTGPNDVSSQNDWADTTSKVNSLSDTVGATATESGRDTLLQKQYARPDYNQGMQNLDQLLLSGNDTAKTAINNSANQWSGLQSQLGNSLKDSQTQAAQAKTNTQSAYDQSHKALDSSVSTLQSDVNSEVQNYTNELNKVKSDISSGTISSDEAVRLGLGNNPVTLYGVDPTNYLSTATLNAQTAATPEQYAQYKALMQLSGQDPTYLFNDALAGSYNSQSLLNKDGFQTALNNAKSAYEGGVNDLMTRYGNTNPQGQAGFAHMPSDDVFSQLGAFSNALQATNDKYGIQSATYGAPIADAIAKSRQVQNDINQYGAGAWSTGQGGANYHYQDASIALQNALNYFKQNGMWDVVGKQLSVSG